MRVAVMMVLVWATWEPVGGLAGSKKHGNRSTQGEVVPKAEGAATKPDVIFTPEWNKIFTGDSITMSCDIKSTVDETYVWYKDDKWTHLGKSYTIQQAQPSDIGRYQCQTNISDKSDSVTLDVLNNYVILQAPLYIFEGDDITLRCSHYPGYFPGETIFYKDDNVIQDWGHESELFIENVFMKSVWRYKCTKQVYHDLIYYQYSDEVILSVQALFTTPVLTLITEGDARILICETSLSPLRQTTELQFAFYRDGSNVQAYSLINRYTVSSNWLKGSGSYTCQVRTSTNTVEKTSLPIKIADTMTGVTNITTRTGVLPDMFIQCQVLFCAVLDDICTPKLILGYLSFL
ncbi:Fc receptor-like protein 3 isoform X2 [Rana temporaria]|uniref:Fc receptor-like protein 3 isoform X2 n=1 Tax=Rana temporaria TaxID=8407 RepID=UPI001AAD6151|nr:Fc receptor-like protein 3 isoform X2 [Rana temporaria]